MTEEIPVWVAILVSLLAVTGAFLTLMGCIGLARFKAFYQRIHAPTIGTSFGSLTILLASMLYFSVLRERPVLHEVIIFVFVSLTTPVTLVLLARAALYRDRAEQNDIVPMSIGPDAPPEVPPPAGETP